MNRLLVSCLLFAVSGYTAAMPATVEEGEVLFWADSPVQDVLYEEPANNYFGQDEEEEETLSRFTRSAEPVLVIQLGGNGGRGGRWRPGRRPGRRPGKWNRPINNYGWSNNYNSGYGGHGYSSGSYYKPTYTTSYHKPTYTTTYHKPSYSHHW